MALVDFTRAEGLDSALGEVSQTRPEALLVFSSIVTVRHRARIIEFALQNRLPLVSSNRAWAGAGALMIYAASLIDSSRRAAAFVDKMLKGAKPADLPVEQPTKFELVINRASRES